MEELNSCNGKCLEENGYYHSCLLAMTRQIRLGQKELI